MVESGTRRKVPALNRHPASAVSGYLSSGGRTSSLPSRQVDKAGPDEGDSDLRKSNQVRDNNTLDTIPVEQKTTTNLLPSNIPADRVFKTICVFYSSVTLGWCIPLLGNTLVHMEYFFHVSTATMSIALMVQAVGALLGSILCGLVFDHVNHELAFAVASVIQGLSTILAPFIGGLVPFMVAVFVQATTVDFIAAATHSYCVRLWSGHRYRDPILHTWNAMWSLGATVLPYIIAPFLVDLPQQHQSASTTVTWSTSSFIYDNNHDKSSNTSTDTLTSPFSWNITSPQPSVSQYDVSIPGVEKVRYTYVTIGLLVFVSHLLFVITYLRSCFDVKGSAFGPPSSSQTSQDSTSLSSSEFNVGNLDGVRLDRYFFLIFLLTVFFFYHFYCYGILIPAMYITSFVIKYLKFPVQSASLLISLFFGFQFVSRVVGIPVAAFVQPGKMLIFNVSLTALSYVLLLALVNVWPKIIWIVAPMASCCMATTFSAGMLWISDRVTMTGRISSIVLVGFNSGAIVGPLIVGQLFERSTPMWFAYVLVFSSVTDGALLFVLMVFDAHYGNRVTRYANVGLHSNDEDASVASRKNSGYKSVNGRDDRLELKSNTETSELEQSSPS